MAQTTELKRILHADDDEDIRAIVQMALEDLGDFELRQCEDGKSALAIVEEFKPQLLLLDYMMPSWNGEETWKQIRQLPGFESVPTVFLTVKAELHLATSLLDQGAVAVIPKPFDAVDLPMIINGIWENVR